MPSNFPEVFNKWKRGEITAVEGMRESGLTKNMFYKFSKIYEEKSRSEE